MDPLIRMSLPHVDRSYRHLADSYLRLKEAVMRMALSCLIYYTY